LIPYYYETVETWWRGWRVLGLDWKHVPYDNPLQTAADLAHLLLLLNPELGPISAPEIHYLEACLHDQFKSGDIDWMPGSRARWQPGPEVPPGRVHINTRQPRLYRPAEIAVRASHNRDALVSSAKADRSADKSRFAGNRIIIEQCHNLGVFSPRMFAHLQRWSQHLEQDMTRFTEEMEDYAQELELAI
jgi:hypothetical protein